MAPVVFAYLVNGQDVRVIQGRRGARFLQKAAAAIFVSDRFFGQHFERHYAVEFFVVRHVDGAHAASADRFENPVMRHRHAGAQKVHRYRQRLSLR